MESSLVVLIWQSSSLKVVVFVVVVAISFKHGKHTRLSLYVSMHTFFSPIFSLRKQGFTAILIPTCA